MNSALPRGSVVSMWVRGGTTARPVESCRKASRMASTASFMGRARATSAAERKRRFRSVMPILPWRLPRLPRRFMARAEGVAARPPCAVQRSSSGNILPTA